MASPDHHVVVIDIGGSYRKLAQMFGGSYWAVELSDRYAFNPFPEKNRIVTGERLDPDILAYLTLILERMILDEGETMNGLGESLIENTLKTVYQAMGKNDVPHAQSDQAGCFSNPKGDQEAQNAGCSLCKQSGSVGGGTVRDACSMGESRFRPKNRVLVFDLERLSRHPKTSVGLFLRHSGNHRRKLRNKALKKMIVIDEGWRFFNDDIGSRLIENLYRTARKMNGMILSISQSPMDFLNTKAANAIISNTYVKYVLRLTKGHDLLPQFGFSKPEMEAIKNLIRVPRKFSDIFLKFNDMRPRFVWSPHPWITGSAPPTPRIRSRKKLETGAPRLDRCSNLASLWRTGQQGGRHKYADSC